MYIARQQQSPSQIAKVDQDYLCLLQENNMASAR
jgi:hypothetical protein